MAHTGKPHALFQERQNPSTVIGKRPRLAKHSVAQDMARLTARQQEVLSDLANGFRTGQIAERLGVSISVVDLHIREARRRLNAMTREQAVAVAIKDGLI